MPSAYYIRGHFSIEERLRKEAGRRAIVVVAVVDRVRVELGPTVVEVEDRGIAEIAIGVRNLFLSIHVTGELKVYR